MCYSFILFENCRKRLFIFNHYYCSLEEVLCLEVVVVGLVLVLSQVEAYLVGVACDLIHLEDRDVEVPYSVEVATNRETLRPYLLP